MSTLLQWGWAAPERCAPARGPRRAWQALLPILKGLRGICCDCCGFFEKGGGKKLTWLDYGWLHHESPPLGVSRFKNLNSWEMSAMDQNLWWTTPRQIFLSFFVHGVVYRKVFHIYSFHVWWVPWRMYAKSWKVETWLGCVRVWWIRYSYKISTRNMAARCPVAASAQRYDITSSEPFTPHTALMTPHMRSTTIAVQTCGGGPQIPPISGWNWLWPLVRMEVLLPISFFNLFDLLGHLQGELAP